jgi:hypothetical protein
MDGDQIFSPLFVGELFNGDSDRYKRMNGELSSLGL